VCRGASYNKRMLSSPTTCATQTRIFAKCRHSIQPVSRTTSIIDESPGQQRRRVSRATAEGGPVTTLLPIMAVVLIAFLAIGLALPVLPLHVHQGLGLSAFVVGLVTGSQFAASLMSRVRVGALCRQQRRQARGRRGFGDGCSGRAVSTWRSDSAVPRWG